MTTMTMMVVVIRPLDHMGSLMMMVMVVVVVVVVVVCY